MDQDERRKRHELSHGVYNFRDVKMHFSRQGWTFRPGPPLSYDHYYIKPGKNPRNEEHKQGVDYFLGEAELVAYARKMKIFGDDKVPSPGLAGHAHRKRRVRSRSSSSSMRASQTTREINSDYSDKDRTVRTQRKNKRHRRRVDRNKVGNSVQNPIAIFSDTSEKDTGNESSEATIDMEQSSEEEEWVEDESSDDESKSSEEEDALEDRSTIKEKPKKKARSNQPSQSPSTLNCKAEGKLARNFGDAEKCNGNYQKPRPLLTTSHKKRSIEMLLLEKQPKNKASVNSSHAKGLSQLEGQRKAAVNLARKKGKSGTVLTEKEANSSVYSVGSSPGGSSRANAHTRWSNASDDNGIALGVAEFSESPPCRPPSRLDSRGRRIRSPVANGAEASSLPLDDQKEGVAAASFCAQESNSLGPVAVAASPSLDQCSTSTSSARPLFPCVAEDACPGAQGSMELTHVVLPPDYETKYHLKVTVSADKPPLYTIWLQKMASNEQRECTFVDVMELPGAKIDTRVPTRSVLTALFRSLSSQNDAVVLVGPEARVTAESKPASEKGEVHLVTSTAEKKARSEGTDGVHDEVTLVVTYPALDLFRIDHNFPMKLVFATQQVQHLATEVKHLRQQLYLLQTDRDKLCEQLRQQEHKLSQQVEAQVNAKLKAYHSQQQEVQSHGDIECRVASLVQENLKALLQTHEKKEHHQAHADT